MDYDRIDLINALYKKGGFKEVLMYTEDSLEYGAVVEKQTGLYMITTAGWSEDELLLDALMALPSLFKRHYRGYIVGGAYYFVENVGDDVEIILKQENFKKTE